MSKQAEPNLTETLARFAVDLKLEDVPADVVMNAKRLLLDTLGAIMAATRTRMAPIAYQAGRMLGSGDEATLAGSKSRASLGSAIYVNARLGNCMDLDETFPVGHHFGIGAVVAALALAEAHKLTGRDLLLAIITGYELGGRLACAAGPPMFIEDGRVTGYPTLYGFSATVVFAAAGAAIKLLGLDHEQALHTLGIAGPTTPVPVMSKWSESVDLPDIKYAEAGWCTLAGVLAAVTAKEGATGFVNILDGDRGLMRMCGASHLDQDALVGELGYRWMLRDITYKPWPTCRWTHHPMTALATILREHVIDPAEVEAVRIKTNRLLCTPRFSNPKPQSFCSRQFSVPHGVAMMLLDVPVGPKWLDVARDDDALVAELREKVEMLHFDKGDAFAQHIVNGQTRRMPAEVAVVMRGGAVYEAETEFALGDPWHPNTAYNDAIVSEKFKTATGMPRDRADTLIGAIGRLEQLNDISALTSALSQASA